MGKLQVNHDFAKLWQERTIIWVVAWLSCLIKPAWAEAGSIGETTNVVNLTQAALSFLGGVSATVITLVRGSLGAEVYQKSLLSTKAASIRRREDGIVQAQHSSLQGVGLVTNMILCTEEAVYCAEAVAQHIWSFGGGEVLIIPLKPFQCSHGGGTGTAAECFKGICTKWHRDQLIKDRYIGEGLVEAVDGEEEKIVVHSGQCRGGLGKASLLGFNQAARNSQRTVVCVVSGFPPGKVRESDISARLTCTLDESQRGASSAAHKAVLGDIIVGPGDRPFWTYFKDWSLWTWWMLSLAECLIAMALSGLFALDSYSAALGARRIIRSYVTDYTGTSDTPQYYAEKVQIEGNKEKGRYNFSKICPRSRSTTRLCRITRLVSGISVPILCQALWWLQTSGYYKVLISVKDRHMWQLWLSCALIILGNMAGSAILWVVVGRTTGYGGTLYTISKPVVPTLLFAVLSMSAVAFAVSSQVNLLSVPHGLASCGVVQQCSCWILWFVGSQAALCAGTVNDRAPWYSTTLVVMSFAMVAGLTVSTGNWTH